MPASASASSSRSSPISVGFSAGFVVVAGAAALPRRFSGPSMSITLMIRFPKVCASSGSGATTAPGDHAAAGSHPSCRSLARQAPEVPWNGKAFANAERRWPEPPPFNRTSRYTSSRTNASPIARTRTVDAIYKTSPRTRSPPLRRTASRCRSSACRARKRPTRPFPDRPSWRKRACAPPPDWPSRRHPSW